MRNWIALVIGLAAGIGLAGTFNGQPWFILLVLPAALFFAWLIIDYRFHV